MNTKQIDDGLIMLGILSAIFCGATIGGSFLFEAFTHEVSTVVPSLVIGAWVTALSYLIIRSATTPKQPKRGAAATSAPFVHRPPQTAIQMTLTVTSIKAARELLNLAESRNLVLQGV